MAEIAPLIILGLRRVNMSRARDQVRWGRRVIQTDEIRTTGARVFNQYLRYSCRLLNLKLQLSRIAYGRHFRKIWEDTEERRPKLRNRHSQGRPVSQRQCFVTRTGCELSLVAHATLKTLGKQYSSSDRPYSFLRNQYCGSFHTGFRGFRDCNILSVSQ